MKALAPEWRPIDRHNVETWREVKNMGMLPLVGSPTRFGVLNIEMIPPSINLLYHESEKTPLYLAAIDKFLILLDRCPQWHIAGDFRARLSFNRTRTKSDLDNLTKPVIDMLQVGLRVQGDHRLVELRAQWSTIVRMTRVELWSADLKIGEKL